MTKKYEEKYKQVAEIVSKLAIEDVIFRDLQVKFLSYMNQWPSHDSIACALLKSQSNVTLNATFFLLNKKTKAKLSE